MLGRPRRAVGAEDGQALVELALALPILLIVLVAILDFGRAVNYWNSENSLANVVARYVAVGSLPTTGPCANQANVTSYISCALTNQYNITPNSSANNGLTAVTPCVSVPTNSPGNPVTVTLTGSYKVLPLVPAIPGITGSATMRIEAPSVPSSLYTTTASC